MQNIFGSLQTIATEGVFYQGMGDGKLGRAGATFSPTTSRNSRGIRVTAT